MKKNYTAFIIALLGVTSLSAQVNQPLTAPCGTHGKSPWLKWYQEHRHEMPDMSADTNWLYVPTTIHSIGDNNGGGHYSETEIFRIMCETNEYFAPVRVRFFLVPGEMIIKHNSTYWYDHDWQGGADMADNTRIPGRMNAYIVDDPAGNCGYAGYDVIVMAKACSNSPASVWAHEAGHHYSLPHTFFGWEGESWDYSQPAPNDWNGWEVERMDGSNCLNSADGFCDTRPDYLPFRWNCNDQMRSNQVQTDPNGEQFTADGTLLMSYADQICMRRFSPDQITAMRQNLYSEHAEYLLNSQEMPPVDDNASITLITPADSAVQQFNNVVLEWAPVENATFYKVEVGLTPGFSVTFYNKYVYDATSVNITSGIPNNRTLYWRVTPYSYGDLCKRTAAVPLEVFKSRDLSSSASEVSQKVEVELSPNPVLKGQPVTLTLATTELLEGQLAVYDIAGKLCTEQILQLPAGEHNVSVETATLTAGHYMAKVQTKWGILTRRFVVD